MSRLFVYLLVLGALVLPERAFAYIGPGAGFAFIGSSFVFVLSIVLALSTILVWPLRWLWLKIRHFGLRTKAHAGRVIVVGLDGLEPKIVESMIAAGELPNLARLQSGGSYLRLATTLPALSPVAWSSFQTGVNPGAHNIFDFLTRDKRTALPELASTTTKNYSVKRLFGLLGRRAGSQVVLTRRSKPFWKILGEHGVFSNIIRVPISYPPEKFSGNILSAMCTPDLRGTQGTFTLFCSDLDQSSTDRTGGTVRALRPAGPGLTAEIEGPPDPYSDTAQFLSVPFILELIGNEGQARIKIGKKRVDLKLNSFSPWVELDFEAAKGFRVSGIVRFCLRATSPQIKLYVSPVNVNPDRPALPISSPLFFSSWLSRRNGLYGTLGLMEDTWGRNEHALDDDRFLEQTYLTHNERELMFFETLKRTRQGLCACVFDASDRIQHMFWRYLEDNHPSAREADPKFLNVIPDMYRKMDRLVGRVLDQLSADDALFVLSDHGFSSFRRGLNLNTWLRNEGYLALKDNKTVGADYFKDVDWTKTRAFAVGLSGLYINLSGREVNGTVSPSEHTELKHEIIEKLTRVTDPVTGERAISQVYDSAQVYRGLYVVEAPDLIVGYNPGYRVSWDSVTGSVEPEVFSDNTKAWSGDHHVDPKFVPGILFCNRKFTKDSADIVDLAPTILDLFGVKVPNYMEGKVLL